MKKVLIVVAFLLLAGQTACGPSAPSLSLPEIAFTSTRYGLAQIYVMNTDGTNQLNLTQNATSDDYPAWSPDGRRIAFASVRGGNSEIYMMNADGSNQVNLTNNAANDSEPAWSPK